MQGDRHISVDSNIIQAVADWGWRLEGCQGWQQESVGEVVDKDGAGFTLAGHKQRIPLAVVLPRPARGAAQQWDCWVIWQSYFQFFSQSPQCSPRLAFCLEILEP